MRGAHKSKAYTVEVASDTGTGHVATLTQADDTAGYAPITIDFAVKKGVIVTGRVIDKSTGKPVPGFVMTDALNANSFVKDYPPVIDYPEYELTGSDGTFRIVSFPGAVILMGGPDPDRLPDDRLAWYRYKPSAADPKHPEFFQVNEGFDEYLGIDGKTRFLQGTGCKVLKIEAGITTFEQNLVLEPATALPVKIRDAAGKPVNGAWTTGIGGNEWRRPEEMKGDTTAAYNLEGKPRQMIFYEPTRKLFGMLTLKGNEKEPATVTLVPGGAIAGRVIGEDGKPLAGVAVNFSLGFSTSNQFHAFIHRAQPIETDAEGRFRIDDILPGVEIGLVFSRGKQQFEWATKAAKLRTESRKTTDAGKLELKLKPQRGE
jgi:hypothetical protein